MNVTFLSYYGSFQSIPCAPCCSSSWLARLNGFDPKNPLCADSGLGCADSMHGTTPSNGLRLRALRPQRIATSGPPRAASDRIACPGTSSQPLPRCQVGLVGPPPTPPVGRNPPALAHAQKAPCD